MSESDSVFIDEDVRVAIIYSSTSFSMSLQSIAWSGAACFRIVCPAVQTSVPCQHRLVHTASLAGRRPATPATLDVGQHAVLVGCKWAGPFPCKNGIVRRVGMTVIQMLVWGHQMIAGGLQLFSFTFDAVQCRRVLSVVLYAMTTKSTFTRALRSLVTISALRIAVTLKSRLTVTQGHW